MQSRVAACPDLMSGCDEAPALNNHIIKSPLKLTYIFIILFLVLNHLQGQNQPAYHKLMPKPQNLTVHEGRFVLDADFLVVIPEKSSRRVQIAATKFIRRLTNRTGLFVQNGFPVFDQHFSQAGIIVHYQRVGKLRLNEDESYKIQITANQVMIQAPTDIGVVFAFETLLQLLDNDKDTYFFQNLSITDKPAFTWRGLMIDASRHFEPVGVIKRNLDAILVAKLNTFHWHLSDDQGFRVEIKKYPQLIQKASDGQYYTQAQIKDIVQYASDRGIRVIPEIDVPGHATALVTAFPEIASQKQNYRLERNAGIFDPTLDPTNPKTYEVLDQIFKELSKLFPFEYMHIGGDENRGKQWNNNADIQTFMKHKNIKSNHELQTYFNVKLQKILNKYHKKLMGWEEIRTKQMPKTALIHVWRGKAGESLVKTVKNGYNAVLSNGFYIDLMLPAASHYKTQLIPNKANLTPEEKSRILGGEATMWGELVTPLTIDSRIWPRTLAIGERLWTNPEKIDIDKMYQRLFTQSYHLEELGIAHIKNRDVILRNITQNQDISSLQLLSRLYEPLKGYTRNKGGTEYQTYSPFMLFADACTADAPDALYFNRLVKSYLQSHAVKDKRAIVSCLKRWKDNHHKLMSLRPNPKLVTLYPMSASLADLSQSMMRISHNLEDIDTAFVKKLNTQYQKALYKYNDVELPLANSLKALINDWLSDKGLDGIRK